MNTATFKKTLLANSFLTIISGNDVRVVDINTATDLAKIWTRGAIEISHNDVEEIATGIEQETNARFDRTMFKRVIEQVANDDEIRQHIQQVIGEKLALAKINTE